LQDGLARPLSPFIPCCIEPPPLLDFALNFGFYRRGDYSVTGERKRQATKILSRYIRSPMQIHRLLTKTHSESLLRGSFRFGRLRYYQMMEIVFADESIGDAQEGTVSALVSTNITPDNTGDPVRASLAKSSFIHVDENASIEIRNATFRNEVDCFVCCWSTSATPDLSGTGSAYDTRVTAAGAKSLAHYLNSLGVERESGSKILELFAPIASGRVQYRDLVHDMATGPLPSGDQFRKRTRYRHQSEYRLVLIPRATIAADYVYIECPQAAELLKSAPVKRSQAVALNASPTPPGDEYFQQMFSSILAVWRQLQRELANNDYLAFSASRSTLDVAAWRADQDASLARRTAALAEFDHVHLKNLRKCLFALRKPPLNEALDRALARGASSDRLISRYEHQQSKSLGQT